MAIANPLSSQATSVVKAVGVIKFVSGEAIAINASGAICRLLPGDKVFPNDIIQTSKEGSVQIEFFSGSMADLGRNHSLLIDDQIFDLAKTFAPSQAEVDDVARIQQAIASGADPTQVAAATAAGEPMHEQSSHSFVEVTPTSGNVQTGITTTPLSGGQEQAPGLPSSPPPAGSPPPQYVPTPTGSIGLSYQDTGVLDGVTNNPNLTIGASAGTHIGSVIASGPSGNVPFVYANGQWSPAQTLADGSYTITVTGTSAGKTLSATTSYTLDTTFGGSAFSVAGGINGAKFNTSTPTISGDGASGTALSVDVHSVPQHFNIVIGADGTWSLVPAPLEDGHHNLWVTEYDNVGNSQTVHFEFDVDTTKPAVSLDNVVIAGDNVINSAEATGTVTLTGSLAALDTNGIDSLSVQLVLGGKTYTGTVTDGHFTIANVPGRELIDTGSVTLTIVATDTFGNATTLEVPQHFSVDVDDTYSIAPVDGLSNHTAQTISGTAEVGSTVVISENGAELVTIEVSDGTWTFSKEFSEGPHQLIVTVTDPAGNSAAYTNTFTIDTFTAAPVIDEMASLTNHVPTISGTAEAGATVTVKDGSTAIGTVTADDHGQWTLSGISFTDGVHNISASATDTAGNTSSSSTIAVFTLDTQNTTAIAIDPITGDNNITAAEANQMIAITGTVTGEVHVGDTVNLTVGGDQYSGTVSDSNGSLSYSIDVPGSVLAGANSISASVTTTDAAGNTATATESLAYTVTTETGGAGGQSGLHADDNSDMTNIDHAHHGNGDSNEENSQLANQDGNDQQHDDSETGANTSENPAVVLNEGQNEDAGEPTSPESNETIGQQETLAGSEGHGTEDGQGTQYTPEVEDGKREDGGSFANPVVPDFFVIDEFKLAAEYNKQGKLTAGVAGDEGDTLDIHDLVSGLPTSNASELFANGFLVFEKTDVDPQADAITVTLKLDADGKEGPKQAQAVGEITFVGAHSMDLENLVDHLTNHNQIKTEG